MLLYLHCFSISLFNLESQSILCRLWKINMNVTMQCSLLMKELNQMLVLLFLAQMVLHQHLTMNKKG